MALTYKAIQTSVHDNDTVTIVATDVAGNKAEQLIIVSVTVIGLSTSVIASINTWKIGANCMNDIITLLKDNTTNIY
jgi:hypothetical protein